MRWRRRRDPPLPPPPAAGLVAVGRFERALVALAVHNAQLEDRIERLEHRTAEDRELAEQAPTHADLLEVRVHSARVAAEVSRLRVQLEAEIDRVTTPSPEEQRLRTLAASIIDLSDRMDTRPGEIAS